MLPSEPEKPGASSKIGRRGRQELDQHDVDQEFQS